MAKALRNLIWAHHLISRAEGTQTSTIENLAQGQQYSCLLILLDCLLWLWYSELASREREERVCRLIEAAERVPISVGPLSLLAVLLLLAGLSQRSCACSTVLLRGEGVLLLGHNLDEGTDFEGFVCVNKRDVYKVGSTWRALKTYSKYLPHSFNWISRYASVTWSGQGRDLPDAGINEAGLAIEEMSLAQHHYPFVGVRLRLFQMQWIQYHLDSFSTVEQVIKSASLVIPDGWSWHFFVADKGGNCAALEYIDNKLVVHTGRDMPITALCNRTYEEEFSLLKNYEGFGGNKAIDLADKDIPRFVRSALMLKKYDPEIHTSGVDYVFSILANLSVEITRRSYVVDIRNGVAYFRTGSHPQIRHFSLNSFDFSCDTPVQILDLNARYSGDVTDKFHDYTYGENRRISENWVNHVLQMYPDKTKEDRIEDGLTPEHIDRYARYPELSLKKSDLPTTENHYGLTQLYWAAYQGDLQKVQDLLGEGADINAGTEIGTTALMAAAQAGHLEVAQHLIDSGADIDAADARGNTALIVALLFGHSEIAIFLIQQGANIKLSNRFDLGPLHYAACNGDLPVLELLLKKGADLEASSKSGFNALMSATESGQLDAVKFLLAKGANIDAVDENGHSPLLISLLLRHWDVGELLIERGADVLTKNKEGITPWKAASGGKNKRIIKLLKDKGAKPKFLGLF